MWKLNKVGESVLNQYATDMLQGLRDRIVNGVVCSGNSYNLDSRVIHILIPDVNSPNENLSYLKGLLTMEPVELENLCTDLMQQIIPGYTVSEFPTYLDNYKKRNLTGNEATIVQKYKDILTKLEKIFDYEGKISYNKDRAYWLTRMKGTNACTYCNRQYTFTVINYSNGRIKEQLARPELDHWFCKQMFPLMSLNFYNLIPSCHTCNSSAKSNVLFSLQTHVHPYLQVEDNPKIHFRQKLTELGWSVAIERTPGSREDNTVKDFSLDDIYKYHGPLEVKDLIDFNNTYSNTYLKRLFNNILGKVYGVKSQEEVYRMLFGTELNPKEFGNRPLSKLKYDILKNLKII